MNRNTALGTLALGLLLILMGMVSQQEAGSINLVNPVQLHHNQSEDYIADQKTTATQPKEMQMSLLANASNNFGFNLFAQINAQKSQDNVVISPSSVALALAMVRNGAGGATKAEMTKALKLDKIEPTVVEASYQKLITTLKTADPDVTLAIANALWVNQNITLKEQFLNTVQEFYQAEVTNLDFADFLTKNKINNWVSRNTEKKIPEIVDFVSPQDALYLTNAIYFKGIWTSKFEMDATVEEPFYQDASSSQLQMMMNQTGDYRYYQNDSFQAVRLPYGKKGELGMYIFLPSQTSNLAEFNQQLNINNWQEWIASMRSQKGNVTIPRFQLEYETNLVDFLPQLGMNQVFDPSQANFSNMSDTPVALDTAKHKTFIEVNEEGTEAAAVTSIGIRITSLQPQDPPFNMKVNRPFFFAIRDDITETILFMGNVVEP